MKYTIELTNKQKAVIECLLEIVRKHIGFNAQLEDASKAWETELQKHRTEAYSKGFKMGYDKAQEECKDLMYTEKDMGEIIDATTDIEYNRGLENAWKLAQKVELLTCGEVVQIFGEQALTQFGEDNNPEVFGLINQYSYKDCSDRVKAYEEKKQAEIKVGDEVFIDDKGRKAVVSRALDNGLYNIVFDNGDTNCVDRPFIAKTGKHYDIESILKELGE